MVSYGDAGVTPRTNAHAYGAKKMPMQSEAQRRAMYAAANGKGTSGIPKSVAQRMVKHDKPGKMPRRMNGLAPSLMRK